MSLPPTLSPPDTWRQAPPRSTAIIGMACRFPGAEDVDAFWALLQRGGVAIGEVPASRWSSAHAPAGCATRGGFVSDLERFDHARFGLSLDEAVALDPQQRLLFEVAWAALQNAAIAPDSLRGRAVGVFVGATNVDYHRWVYADTQRLDARSAAGSSLGSGANRLSYLLDLRGPSITVDTGCSSSLVALHQARRALAHDECDLAIVAGVNAMLLPGNTISHSHSRSLSASQVNRAFDQRADGHVRGEGCGAVVLARAGSAECARRQPLAWVAGSAVGQSGQTNGFGAPSGPAQQQVMHAALRDAALGFAQIDCVECHGSATVLGDAIEIATLEGVAKGDAAARIQPCWVGSVKNNIGHLEAAAGMAGLIKLLLAFDRETIPPHAGVDTPSVQFKGTEGLLRLAQHGAAWPRGATPRRAGLNAFSFGGTNSHVVLESGDRVAVTPDTAFAPRRLPVAMGAHSATQLGRWAAQLAGWLRARPEGSLRAAAEAINAVQPARGVGVVIAAESLEALVSALDQVARETGPGEGRFDARTRPTPVRMVMRGADAAACQGIDRLAAGLPGLGRTLGSLRALAQAQGADTPEAAARVAGFVGELALARFARGWLGEVTEFEGVGDGRCAALCMAGLLPDADALRLLATAPMAGSLRDAALHQAIARAIDAHGARPPGWACTSTGADVCLQRPGSARAGVHVTVCGDVVTGAPVVCSLSLLPTQAAPCEGYVQALVALTQAGAVPRLREALPPMQASALDLPPPPGADSWCPVPGGSYAAPAGKAPDMPDMPAASAQAAVGTEARPPSAEARPAPRAVPTFPASAPGARAAHAPVAAMSFAPLLLRWIAARLQRDPATLPPDQPMSDLGMTSNDFVALAVHVSDLVGHPVEPVVFWSHPTVDALATHLDDLAGPARPSPGASPAPLAVRQASSPSQPLTAADIDALDDADAEQHLDALLMEPDVSGA